MKHGWLILLLVLVSCASVPSSKVQKAYEKPIALKFSKNWRSHYLIGTIHLPLDIEKMYPQLFSMIDESTAFVSEISFKATDSLAIKQMESQQNYYKKGEGSLKNDLSPEAYAWVSEQLEDFSEQTFASLKPARAWGLIQEKYKDAIAELDAKTKKMETEEPIDGIFIRTDGVIYDAQLENYAREKNKKMIALEDTGDKILQKCAQIKAVFAIESVAYDLKRTKTNQIAMGARQKYNTCILAERNKEWIQKLKPILEKENKVFIAVGMGHLYIKNDKASSLISILESEGYKVQPLSP